MSQAQKKTTSRRELARNPRFEQVSPEVGELDEAAMDESMRDDPDETMAMLADLTAATDPKLRTKLFGDLQRLLATDAVNAFIFNPANVVIARKGLKGLWAGAPIFANDIAALSWQ